MAHARVKALEHGVANFLIAQQLVRGKLHIAHVHPPAQAFEALVFIIHGAQQPRDAPVIVAARLLALGGEQLQHLLLRGAHRVYALQLVRELARLALLGQQNALHARPIACFQRRKQRIAPLLH